jgi:hypothetical protein
MRMCGGARHGAVALAHGWSEPVTRWTRMRGKRLQSCGSYGDGGESNWRKKKGE